MGSVEGILGDSAAIAGINGVDTGYSRAYYSGVPVELAKYG